MKAHHLLWCLLATLACRSSPPPPPPLKTPIVSAHMDVCPNPIYESMIWQSIEGTVVHVERGDRFELLTTDGRHILVLIANIDSSSSMAASSAAIRKLIRNRSVEVLVTTHFNNDDSVQGVVQVGSKDVAEELLATGAARFKDAPNYTLSAYTECLHKLAEKDAQSRHLGLWSQRGH